MAINKQNVGKIAERIVMNELEAHGYRVTDLNKDGVSANADLLAIKDENVWQIQVKGATNKCVDAGDEKDDPWWVNYGYCTDDIISDTSKPMFNRKKSFYKADIIILVAVRTPSQYRCIVLPLLQAEKLAQMNIERGFRPLKKNGEKKKPGKAWVHIEAPIGERAKSKVPLLLCERMELVKWERKWNLPKAADAVRDL